MSLILDALKKIEQDKRRSDDGGASEVVAASRSRFGGRYHWLSMGAMAIGSALLTAVVVSLLHDREPAPSPIAEEASAAMTVATDPLPEPEVPRFEKSPLVASPTVATETESTRASAEKLEPSHDANGDANGDDGAEPAESAAASAVVEEATSDEPSNDDLVDDDSEIDEENDVDEIQATQPIRLVGQERILLDGLNVGHPSGSTSQASEDAGSPPEDFPELVLQGTSVIGGNAVAVISDQRVFEGDRIEGALVVRIGEREVELEVDGERFKLRL